MNSVGTARGMVSARAMPVARGVYALRYIASAVMGEPLRVVVSIDPDCADDVQLLFGPGATAGVLRQPGDLCVVSAERDATVLITTLGDGADRLEAVTLHFDRIDQEAGGGSRRQAMAALPGPQAAFDSGPEVAERSVPLRIGGHVERRGDLFVTGGEWLGDPNGSARIEGFSIQWPRRPANVDISYGCSLLGLGRMPEAVVGEFVGTRMQARAINGISFRLIGEQADSFALIVEASFSDGTRFGPAMAPVDLRGPTGREFLVGLRLQLSEVGTKNQRPTGGRAPAAAGRQDAGPRKPARIFRAPRSTVAV